MRRRRKCGAAPDSGPHLGHDVPVGRHADDIEVVVLAGDDEDLDVAVAPEWERRRRWLGALVATVVVLVVLGGPVVVGQPVEEVAGPPPPPTTEGPRCPGPDTVRLWCSFVADTGCCPPGEGSRRGDTAAGSTTASQPADAAGDRFLA